MKPVLRFRMPLICALAALISFTSSFAGNFDYGTVTSIVAQALEEGHYSQQPLNAAVSKQLLADYLDNLDDQHLYFTKSDIDAITNSHETSIGKEVREGRLAGAFEIFDLYKKRVTDRVTKITAMLKEAKFDFSSNRTVEINREHAAWPVDETEADHLWRDQIEEELLDEKLNGSSVADAYNTVLERYQQMLSELQQESRKDAMSILLNALAAAYDPHSEYLRKEDLDDLDSDMDLSMVGIGVVIESAGPYVRIVNLLPGSPAAADGRLKTNDRIIAIARNNGKFVDIAGMSMDHVLDLIRGKKGTHIHLKVASGRGGADSSERKVVDLVTNNIALVDDEAKAEVVQRVNTDGAQQRLGWITLPSFYGDPNRPDGSRVSRDVRTLVMRLEHENVSGIVVDLRNNPGGELEEAVDVAGVFLGKVPIVQEKDGTGKIYVSKSTLKKVYSGPLVVITDHSTASAAELLAGALQDYDRAVIVGGHCSTYGKGSVQTVVEVGDMLVDNAHQRDADQWGALQVTIAKFYRVNGQSTQLRGLKADIELPSPEDLPSEGEASMKNPLQYDEIKPASFTLSDPSHLLPIAQLKERSATRIATDPEFQYLTEDLQRQTSETESNHRSLNEVIRKAEMELDKKRDKDREAERKKRGAASEEILAHYSPHDGRDKMIKTAAQSSPDAGNTDVKQPDAIKDEALNILGDLVRFNSENQTATAAHLAKTSAVKTSQVDKTP